MPGLKFLIAKYHCKEIILVLPSQKTTTFEQRPVF